MATDRYLDLLKQGFMRPRSTRIRQQPKQPAPIVACDDCRNWHRKGKHTASLAVRRANRKERDRV